MLQGTAPRLSCGYPPHVSFLLFLFAVPANSYCAYQASQRYDRPNAYVQGSIPPCYYF